MGEIMRWRLARGAQRRIPDPVSTVSLDGPYQIPAAALTNLQNLQQLGWRSSNYGFYSQILVDALTVRQQLTSTTGPLATIAPVAAALLDLDKWLVTNDNRPSVLALNDQITPTLGAYFPPSNDWQNLHPALGELLYAALIFPLAPGTNVSSNFVQVPAILARLMLVMALVDTLQLTPAAIITPDQVFAALRWRTLIFPDAIRQLLLANRNRGPSVLVRKPGFADLYITREEWDHYEAAEIASIENILGREVKGRVHILVNQTTTTSTTETTTTQLREQDTTTTDLSQLQQQSSSDISLAAHIDGQVDTSGLYGTTQVNTHLGGSLDYSTHDATSKATMQSHETVARAVSKIEQTTRQVRTVSTLTRATDKEEHKFDNTGQTEPVVGIYRWVDQIQNVELDRYPHRFLLEFELPEPGSWTRWLHLNDLARNMINKPPIPLTASGNAGDPPLRAADIGPLTYQQFAARYNAAGITGPPMRLVVAQNVTVGPLPGSAGDNSAVGDLDIIKVNSNLTVPDGYYAESGSATVFESDFTNTGTGGAPPPPGQLFIALGAGAVTTVAGFPATGVSLPVGNISQSTVPLVIDSKGAQIYSVTVELSCEPLPQTYLQWQIATLDLITAAYKAMLQANNDERAGLTIQQTNLVDANSPDLNAKTTKQEIKRQVIEMLIGKSFRGRDAISWGHGGTLATEPTTDLAAVATTAAEVQFLEQAFEWETLSYICYPYYWADSSRWPDLAVIEGNDPDFADFLRAGSARVVLAARPGFEDQVNFYAQFGILWGGGPMPAPGDDEYLSVADEIKAQQLRPRDVTVVDTWQVRLPTTLIWLDNPAGLPSNPNPTINTIAAISNLFPTAGSVGDTVTITGMNFGDVVGTSVVAFNGRQAIPSRWSANSIDVAVPPGATTGDVVVTVNGVASNGMSFTVN